MRSFIVLIVSFVGFSSGGFCASKTIDGWYCDRECDFFGNCRWLRKFCEDQDKEREQYCGLEQTCSSGFCRDYRFCERTKTPNPQLLSWCRGIVSYTVDFRTDETTSDANAKSYSELVTSYSGGSTTQPPVSVNGTTSSPPQTTSPSTGIDCPATYKRFGCVREFISCVDSTNRRSCKDECAKVNICNTGGIQVNCTIACSSSNVLTVSLILMIAITVLSVMI